MQLTEKHIYSVLQKSIPINANKISQPIRNHKAKTSAASTMLEHMRYLKHKHRSCSRTLFCVAHFLAAKPWNQSGKFPLLRIIGACVSVNHLSTSSFRPPSEVPTCRSNFFSILAGLSGADSAAVAHHACPLLRWCLTLTQGRRAASFDCFRLASLPSESWYCFKFIYHWLFCISLGCQFILLRVFLVPDFKLYWLCQVVFTLVWHPTR